MKMLDLRAGRHDEGGDARGPIPMLLVIESATAACSAALIDDGTLIGERHECFA